MTEKIGFVGVGRMGANMARRLKEVGYTVAVVYDTNAATAQALAQELGCAVADDLKTAAGYLTATYSLAGEWGSNFQAQYTITNGTASTSTPPSVPVARSARH